MGLVQASAEKSPYSLTEQVRELIPFDICGIKPEIHLH